MKHEKEDLFIYIVVILNMRLWINFYSLYNFRLRSFAALWNYL